MVVTIVVTTPPVRGDFELAAELAHAARAAGAEVSLFFMDAAVGGLAARRDAVTALRDTGCELIACGRTAEAHAVDGDALGIELGSQDDHAALVHGADRVVAFT